MSFIGIIKGRGTTTLAQNSLNVRYHTFKIRSAITETCSIITLLKLNEQTNDGDSTD